MWIQCCELRIKRNDNGLGLLNEKNIWFPDSLQVQDYSELLRYNLSKEEESTGNVMYVHLLKQADFSRYHSTSSPAWQERATFTGLWIWSR